MRVGTLRHRKADKVQGEPKGKLPRVIPSRDNSRCPHCGAHGYTILPWDPPEYYDQLLIKVRCSLCEEVSYIGPKLTTRRRVSANES